MKFDETVDRPDDRTPRERPYYGFLSIFVGARIIMENRGLIFIPDISGFSRFVTQIEIDHSKLIIKELLEVLIEANELDLEISEIEGDAILFYRFGRAPELRDLYNQVRRMFCEFHRQLEAYHIRKYCHCKACVSAIHLTLKVITHYGEFTTYEVGQFNKLIGRDIVIAHRFLKNDIPGNEYWLVTRGLVSDADQPEVLSPWMQWRDGFQQTEGGEIPYHYTVISPLKQEIPPEPPLSLEISERVRVLSVSHMYDAHLIRLFHAAGDFRYRSRWMVGVRSVGEMDHYLPRVGMRCRYTLDNGQAVVYASSYSIQPDRIEFGETDEKKTSAYHYTLEKTGEHRTRLTIDYYLRKAPAGQVLFGLFRKKRLHANLQKSLMRLEQVVSELQTEIVEPDLSEPLLDKYQ